MERQSRLALLLFILTLITCLLLIGASCLILRQASLQGKNAEDLLDAIQTEGQTSKKESNTTEKSENPDTEVNADILYDVFYLREANGKIGIFTDQGYLVRTLAVDVATLPEADRSALSEGICVTSWRELIALIEDYES